MPSTASSQRWRRRSSCEESKQQHNAAGVQCTCPTTANNTTGTRATEAAASSHREMDDTASTAQRCSQIRSCVGKSKPLFLGASFQLSPSSLFTHTRHPFFYLHILNSDLRLKENGLRTASGAAARCLACGLSRLSPFLLFFSSFLFISSVTHTAICFSYFFAPLRPTAQAP